MRVLMSVYDKTGLDGLRPRPGRAGTPAHRQRRHGRGPGGGGHPACHSRVGHRCARSCSAGGSRPCTPASTPASWPTSSNPPTCADLDRAGHRAHRAGGLQPVPVPDQPVHRADRRGWPVHGAGRGQKLGPRGLGRRSWLVWGGPRGATPHGVLSDDLRRRLAAAAFAHTAAYDAAIANWFAAQDGDELPATIHLSLEKAQTLRYGENPHQRGARYRQTDQPSWWDDVVQHGGLALSYLNLYDADAAWRLVHQLADLGPTAAVVVNTPTRVGLQSPPICSPPTTGPSSAIPCPPSGGSWRSPHPSPRRWPPRWSATPGPTC